MRNKEILKLLKFTASLLELHNENEFKIKSYNSATFNLDKVKVQLSALSVQELEQISGIGKGIAAKIFEISKHNTFAELEQLIADTPVEVVQMLDIKGIGPKKVRAIWKELEITTIEALTIACKEGRVAALKGFGEKIQEEILEYLAFIEASKGKVYYADVEQAALDLEILLKEKLNTEKVALVGDIRRKLDVVERLQYIITTTDRTQTMTTLAGFTGLIQSEQTSSPYIWRGYIADTEIKIEIKLCAEREFVKQQYIHSCSTHFLASLTNDGKPMHEIVKNNVYQSEKEIFVALEWQYIEPELREGLFEIEAAKSHTLPTLITDADLKGSFHNHSKYSDGENTLEEMAVYCKQLGYQYLGISDHSKTATYASGLKEEDILRQHKEIDELNSKLAPFKIFKGIESDILSDGSLDYDESVLKTFDFIVASIHANLNMDEEKATQRLIKAIENPYTTMLGHPTGRLLLRRKGYPINHGKVIEACAANGVIIEINANPWRLDLDWRWVNYAIQKGVMLSINPDAHELEGYLDMHYGVCTGRKAGLSADRCFNTKSLAEVESYLNKRYKAIN